ncbi:hypothetical protein [Bacillus methanolicus]|nr:hypothetical protein [Bacillus methanolicus]
MITKKDFYYLTDMLSWNLLGFKKAHFAASQCQFTGYMSQFPHNPPMQ